MRWHAERGAGSLRPVLSVVLPLRCTSQNAYLLERLAWNLEFFAPHPEVECVVVDSASSGRYRERIRALCDRPRCRLVEDPAPQHPFAPGLVRNAGALAARGSHLFFYDVDLCAGPELVAGVLAWIDRQQEERDFAILPCLYLTRAGTDAVGFRGAPVDLEPFLWSLLKGENHLVAHLAVSTSTIVVTRRHFLHAGGNRPEYRGHGCEDLDLLHRLTSYRPLGKRPDDYYVDHKTRFPGDYRGFRAYWARYALPNLFEGLYTAHLWHPRPLERPYHRRRRKNELLMAELLRRHDAGERTTPLLDERELDALSPLPHPWSEETDERAEELGDFIRDLMRAHGLDPETHPGLFRWKEGVSQPRGTLFTKARKLLLSPRRFFADSKVRWIRRIAARWSSHH